MNAHELAATIIAEAREKQHAEERRLADELRAFEEETDLLVREKRRGYLAQARRIEREQKQRLEAGASRKAQLSELVCKQEILDDVFRKAEQRIAQLSGQSRSKVLAGLLKRAEAELPSARLIVSKKDKIFLAKSAKIEGTNYCIGGFIAQSSDRKVRIDLTFETLLSQVRSQHTEEIAHLLWGGR